jgi:ketosteroid isomerase-like protein
MPRSLCAPEERLLRLPTLASRHQRRALSSGGKRIRIVLMCAGVLAACGLLGGVERSAANDVTKVGSSAPDEHSRATLEKLYDQMNQALANADNDTYLSFFDPADFVFIDPKGKSVAAAAYSADLRKNSVKKRNENGTTTIKDIQHEDGRMIAYIQDDVHVEIVTEKGKWIPFNITQTSEDTWAAKGGEWKLVRSKTLRVQQTTDPRWIEAQKKINDMWYDTARSGINVCNYSINGCR